MQPQITLEEFIAELVDKRISRAGKQKDYSVAIVGAGGVGSAIATCLVGEVPEINKLFLSNRDLKKAEGLRRELKLKRGNVEVEVCPYNRLEDLLGADIAVISAGEHHKDRMKLLEVNPPIIRGIAEQFKGYNKTAIVVTNPVDLMTYVFALYSGMNPAHVVGLSHLDTVRLRSIIEEKLSQEFKSYISGVEAYVIGAHDAGLMLPVFSQTRLSGIPLDALKVCTEEYLRRLKEETELYGPNMVGLFGSTAIGAAEATKQVIKAIIDEEDVVTASTFVQLEEEGKGLFIGYPVKFRDFGAEKQSIELSDGERQEFARIHRKLEEILDNCRREGLIEDYVTPVEEKVEETNGDYQRLKLWMQQQINRVSSSLTEKIEDKQSQLYRKFESLLEERRKELEDLLQKSRTDAAALANLVNRVETLEGTLEQELNSIKLHRPKPKLKGYKLFAASRGQIYVFDLEKSTLKPETSFNCINSAAYVNFRELNGKPVLLVGTKDVQIWSLEGMGELERILKVHNPEHRINSIDVAVVDGKLALFGSSRDNKVYMWDLNKPSSRPEKVFTGAAYGLNGVVVVGNYLVAAGDRVYVWDLRKPDKPIEEVSPYNDKEFTSVTKKIIQRQMEEFTAFVTKVTKKDTRKEPITVTNIYTSSRRGYIYPIFFDGNGESPSGQLCDIGRVCDVEYKVNCLDAFSDGFNAYLAAAVFGGSILGWKLTGIMKQIKTTLEEGEEISKRAFKGSTGEILTVKIAEIGGRNPYLFAGGRDHNIYMWDFNRPERPLQVFNLEHTIESIAVGRL